MALIVVRDIDQNRDRIINTDFIFHCTEHEGAVRINYTQGLSGRDHCIVAGSLDDFARSVAALRVG